MSTYVPIQAITLSAATADVTFTGIPQTFTDLVIVANVQLTTSGQSLLYQFNSDTGTNYSLTILKGNGTSATSDRRSSIAYQLAAGWDAGLPTSSSFATGIINVQNYSNATTNKTSLARGSNAAGGDVTATVNLWRNTAAITSIRLYTGSGNLASGSTFTLYGVGSGSPKAFGGDEVRTDGTFWYHIFRSSGRFEPVQNLSCDVLLVAGGGAGRGGGGGAGGVFYATSQAFTAKNYTVAIGAGGTSGASGSNTTFTDLTNAVGGGRGGDYGVNGVSGGSGGGGASSGFTGGSSTQTGTGGTGYGNSGGNGAGGATQEAGGGGGGAGAVGVNATTNNGGAGGAGVSNSITGTAVTYAGGGGGGGKLTGGTGGTGGGGNGTTTGGVAGTANTGGGGGGGYTTSGGAGGSGIVIVRYAV